MAWLRALIGFVLALLLVSFAVLNTQDATLIWSPVHKPLVLPMAFAGLILMALAFTAAAVFVWLNGLPGRLKAARLERELQALRRALDDTQNALEHAQRDQMPPEQARPKGLLQALPRYGR